MLRGLIYQEVQEAISYDQYLISIGALKDDLKEAYEQKIEQMVNDHTAEVQRFQTMLQNLEQEKRDIDELNASISNERNAKIAELTQNLLDFTEEKELFQEEFEKAIQGKDKTINALTNKIGDLQNTINSMTKNNKDQIHDLLSQNVNLSSQNDSFHIQIETLKKVNKDEIMQLRLQNADFETKNYDLTNLNVDLKYKVDDLKCQLKNLIDQIKETEEEHQTKVNKLSFENEELRQTAEKCKVRIGHLKSNPVFSIKKQIQNLFTEIYGYLEPQ
jgi:DNA repair exonuclease SbcCD ATPase subunit